MESYSNYSIQEFVIESSDGINSIDVTRCVSSIQYYEDLFSPSIFISMLLVNTDGLLSSLPNKDPNMSPGIKGGERVRLIIDQPATKQSIKLDETKNTYYIYKIYASTTESTREAFIVELCPSEVFTNETSRVIRKYKENIGDTVNKILTDVLKTSNYDKKNIELTRNKYVFYGNIKRPFTVLTWLCPKSIPAKVPVPSKSDENKGTAGFLFYQNKNGFNFKSVDSLMSGFELGTTNKRTIVKYYYAPGVNQPADVKSNFRILNIPTFEKNVNIMENLRIGMYSSQNYFFDINARKFNVSNYRLKDSYDLMGHASASNKKPQVPLKLDESPSRVMVRILDNFNADPANDPPNPPAVTGGTKDETSYYQAQSVARYNLAFSQKLNITIPLNLNLTVGDVIELDFGNITKNNSEQGIKDIEKSGHYLIKELSHLFEKNQGYTGLKLIRDSYGAPPG
jgi:hypothetical protein